MRYIMLLFLGVVLCGPGIANIRGDPSSIKACLRLAVPEHNLAKYSRRMGIGTVVVGLSAAGAAAVQMIHETEFIWWLLFAGVNTGFALMAFAQMAGSGLLQRIQLLWRSMRAKRDRHT